MEKHFGEHITIDGYGADKDLLNDSEFIVKFLKDLVDKVEMNILFGPEIVFAPANNKKDPGGWSAFVIVAESHISIHTFPEKGFLSADVYTCKNGMDREKIKSIFRNAFKIQEIEDNFILRGKKYV